MDEAGKRIDGIVRLYGHKGEVIVRDSEEHDEVASVTDEIRVIDRGLERIDREFGSRAVRALMRKTAKKRGAAPADGDLKRLDEAETRAEGLREKRAALGGRLRELGGS
jgi:hypothetical protein